MVSRERSLWATDVLKAQTHAEFDRLLMEFGIEDLSRMAGHDAGGLQARSVALAKYALKHLEEVTAEGNPLAETIVQRAEERTAQTGQPVRTLSEFSPPGITAAKGPVSQLRNAGDSPAEEPFAGRAADPAISRGAESEAGDLSRRRVFIGHGRSHLWRALKDFVQDRLGLPWDEFNRVSPAGIPNAARLAEMLDAAGFAFIVLTGEDERVDGTLQARTNAVHEAGLFQGRLGFGRAIIVLEEGCEEFSNIQGLGQIRFPKGNVHGLL